MLKIGSLSLGSSPKIAVCFKDGAKISDIAKASKLGMDLAELRIDQFRNTEPKSVLKEIAKFKSLPLLATIRSKAEGGGWKKSDGERFALYYSIIPKVSAVDIELSSNKIIKQVIAKAHAHDKKVIVSYHNFKETPSLARLNSIARSAKSAGGDIVKVACMPKTQKDIHTLALWTLENLSKNVISIAMGTLGSPSRILFPAIGSLITYCSSDKNMAPGQLKLETTASLIHKLYP